MDLKALGNVILEALALRGQINSMEKDMQGLQSEIDANEAEMKRLEKLMVETEELKAKCEKLKDKHEKVKKEYEVKCTELSDNGVSLDLTTRVRTVTSL